MIMPTEYTRAEAYEKSMRSMLHGNSVLEGIIWARFFAGETAEVGSCVLHKAFRSPAFEPHLRKAEAEGYLQSAQAGLYAYTTDLFHYAKLLTEDEDSEMRHELIERVAYLWELQIKARHPERQFEFAVKEIDDGEWGISFYECKKETV
jgi:hypothetical protein